MRRKAQTSDARLRIGESMAPLQYWRSAQTFVCRHGLKLPAAAPGETSAAGLLAAS
jgi:hypothetical protein